MNLLMLLEMVADTVGDRVAVGSRDDGLTYAELLRRARIEGTRLQQAGVEAAAVVDETSACLPIALFGAAAGGVPFAPLNYRLADEQLKAAVDELAPVRVLVGPDQQGRIASSPHVQVVGRDDVMAAEGRDPGTAIENDVAVLLFTSGTSGTPKVVVLRHANLVSYVLGSVEFLGAGEDEAILVSVPPYHIAGVSTILTSVYTGRRMVQLPSFTPEGWVDLVRDEGVTQAMVVPTMLGRVLDVLEERGEQLPTLKHLAYGGGRMPRPVIERALRVLPEVNFVNAYGLTETSSTIAVLGPEDHRAAIASEDPDVRARLGSVGRPAPTIEIVIRDEAGRPVPAGTPGELFVRGPQVSGEYRGRSALEEDGWFPTRDRARLDAAGYLFLEGRADDVIVRGGENMSPGEIEDVLLDHPAVLDAVVVGVPDTDWGERVEACVVLAHDVDEPVLQDWVRARLRSSKVPARVHVRTELPRNELGKLRRIDVRLDLATDSVTPEG